LFFQEYEQNLNFIDEERDKIIYLSALKLLSEINFITSLSNYEFFIDMIQMALILQARLVSLLINFTYKELQD
jgi:hypothetical protein